MIKREASILIIKDNVKPCMSQTAVQTLTYLRLLENPSLKLNLEAET